MSNGLNVNNNTLQNLWDNVNFPKTEDPTKVNDILKSFYSAPSAGNEGDVNKAGLKDKGPAPDLPKDNAVTAAAVNNFFVASPSPGCLLAALCIKEAAAQNEQNTNDLMKRSQAVQEDMLKQADNIKAGALKQMICQIAGAAATAVTSAVAGVKTLKIGSNVEGADLHKAMVPVNNWKTMGTTLETTANSIGNYLNAREQADNKKLDAKIEQERTMMEAIRGSQQAQRDLVSKSIDFMNAMQSNMNQTRAKILV